MGRRQRMRDAAEEVVMAKGQKHRYFASMAFDYGGQELDRGQVIDGLRGLPNDAVLRGRGYFRRMEADDVRVQCGRCGAWFNSDVNLRGHGAKRHIDVEDAGVKKALELEAIREEDRRLVEQPPIKIGPPAEVQSAETRGPPIEVQTAPSVSSAPSA